MNTLSNSYAVKKIKALNKKQSGATLIISLIILAVLTVIGVASMQNSGLELKMISSAHDRSVAFEAVETALLKIEEDLALENPNFRNNYTECGSDCFSPDCSGGLCFAGNFNAQTEREYCYIADATTNNTNDFWADETLDVWNDAGKHRELAVEGLNTTVKYIIEFLCFTNVGLEQGAGFSTQSANAGTTENENYKPLYRITAMASGNANRATVVLQTTYRVVE